MVGATCIKDGSASDPIAWAALLADFDSLATGVVDGADVARDADGTRWKAILLIATADEEARCNEFGLPHYGSDEPCSECMANRTTRPYTDLRAEAAWRPSESMTFQCYVARVREPLFTLWLSPTTSWT